MQNLPSQPQMFTLNKQKKNSDQKYAKFTITASSYLHYHDVPET